MCGGKDRILSHEGRQRRLSSESGTRTTCPERPLPRWSRPDLTPLKKQTRRRCSGVPGAGFAHRPGPRGISPDRKRLSNGAKAEAAAEQTPNLRPRPHTPTAPFMGPVIPMGLPRTAHLLQPGVSI